MEKKNKKILDHPFYDRFTIPGAIVLAALGMIGSQGLIGGVIGGVSAFIAAKFNSSREVFTITMNLGAVCGGFAVLAIFRRWFYPEYEGGLRGGRRVPFWTLVGIGAVAAVFAATIITGTWRPGMLSATSLAVALSAGVCEEAAFRGMTVSYLMRQWRGQSSIPSTIILSSVLFGLVHGSNILVGAPVAKTIIQILSATATGCFLGALFLRSGNLIPLMIMHFLFDVVAFMSASNIKENGAFNENAISSIADVSFELVLGAAFIALTIYLTRPAVRGEICEMWEKKWVTAGQDGDSRPGT